MAEQHRSTPVPQPAPPAAGLVTDAVDPVPPPGPELDLSTPEGVRAYLANTAFAGADVVELTGGFGNYVFRLHLVGGGTYDGKNTVVLKHAKGYAKAWRSLVLDVERQVYEVEALKRIHDWLPNDAVVTVPKVLLFDKEKHVIVMEDAGVTSVDLKTFMKTCSPSPALAKQIGQAVGVFLGKLHAWGLGNNDICNALKGNPQAKELSAWVYYGRLESTLNGADAPDKLKDPQLIVGEADLDVVRRVVSQTTARLFAANDAFVMGDFWPGNLMVLLDTQGNLERIYVVDWELTKTSLISQDIGQFCAEIYMLGRCYPSVCGETAPLLLEYFLKAYKDLVVPDDIVVRDALIRWGAHMVVLGARVDWGDKAISREIVLEGLKFIVEGSESSTVGHSVAGMLI